jgi:hypothetical protein
VDGPVEAPELVFFDRAGTRPVYVARFRNGKPVSSEVAAKDSSELSASRLRLIAARKAAVAALGASAEKRCSEAAMNSVVLAPAAAGEPTLVYILTPQRWDPNTRTLRVGDRLFVEGGRIVFGGGGPANPAALDWLQRPDPSSDSSDLFVVGAVDSPIADSPIRGRGAELAMTVTGNSHLACGPLGSWAVTL